MAQGETPRPHFGRHWIENYDILTKESNLFRFALGSQNSNYIIWSHLASRVLFRPALACPVRAGGKTTSGLWQHKIGAQRVLEVRKSRRKLKCGKRQ